MTDNRLNRRMFLAVSGVGAASLARFGPPAKALESSDVPERRFYTVLSCGRIGVKANFQESVDLAAKHGFEGVDPDPGYFSQLSDDGLRRLLDELKTKNLRLSSAGLPVEFRKDDSTFSEGLKKLLSVAKVLQKAGVERISTWISSSSDDLTYLQNLRTHAYRLRACAEILKEHGQRLGLEYVGPKTSWRSEKHPFIHTLSETKELIVAIGTGNVGVQLDSWHWFNAEETVQDLLTLHNEDIITVDLNDAPVGGPLDKQMDSSRELPAATGVIPVKVFLDALRKIGYEGPIHAEPFNAALRAMPRDEACAATAAAMKKALTV
jgi:sugar phosphate isomerase/epimerase